MSNRAKCMGICALLLVPMLASAQPPTAAIVDLFCDEVGQDYRLYFSVINNAAETTYGICDLHIVATGCTISQCAAPVGWSCFDSPFGADFFANAPADCMAVGETKADFSVLMDSPICNFLVQYTDGTGAVVFESEETIDCATIEISGQAWSTIKDYYR